MIIADAHCDTLYNIAIHNADPKECAVTAEKMKAGGVGLQTFAMFTCLRGPQSTPYQDGVKMMAAIDRLGVPVYTGRLPDALPEEPAGVISIEGGEMLEGRIDRLDEFYNATGVRMIALTWNYENEIGYPGRRGPNLGLKPFGLELLKEMDKRGVYADVSHINDPGFWDVVNHMELPPIASHSNVRALCENTRNLRDDQIRAVIEKKGFIGINFYNAFLVKDRPATLEDVFVHIDYIAQMGGIDVIGFGSDFDGIDEWPEGLAHSGEFGNLIEMLRNHGYAEKDIEAIAGGNLWRLLKKADQMRGA